MTGKMPANRKRVTKVVPRVKKNRIKKDGTKGNPNWGGKRKGAGRPTIEEEMKRRDHSVQAYRTRYLIQPLNYVMCILNDLNPKTFEPLRRPYSDAKKEWAVEKAIPYLHHRLAAMQLTGADNGPVKHTVDVRKLSDQELLELEKIMSKAQEVITEENDGNEEGD